MLNKIPGIYLAVAILAVVVVFYVYSTLQRHKSVYSGHGEGGTRFGTAGAFDEPIQRFALADSLRKLSKPKPSDLGKGGFLSSLFRRTPQVKQDALTRAALIAEINQLLEQEGMPADVFKEKLPVMEKDKKKWEEAVKKKEQDEKSNIAITLFEQFNEYYTIKDIPKELTDPLPKNISEDELKKIQEQRKKQWAILTEKHWENSSLRKLWDATPDGKNIDEGKWDIDQQTLDNVSTILANFEEKRRTIRTKLGEPGVRFDYIYVYPDSKTLKSSSNTGRIVNTDASRFIADYALLEEYAMANALLKGDIGEATAALAHIFRMAQLASSLKVVGVRVDAAAVRLRAFVVMQRVVLDPQFEKKHLINLRNILSYQYDFWRPEYDTWFGDRASGVAFYHRVFAEGADAALEDADWELLLERWGERKFNQGFKKYHEADEVFYLQSMQKILDVCHEPYVKRNEVLSQMAAEIRKKENNYDADGVSQEFLVAYLLLKDVRLTMEIFARDQSALDRALAAILFSLGQTDTDKFRDPFTDEPYEIRKVNSLITVTATALPQPFQVPDFRNKE
jgi:hypothetical protein